MNEQDRHDQFVELITSHQSQLYGYIFALVRNRDDADDLFQSVGLILWQKFESFAPDTSFISWARQTARFAACNFLRRKKTSYVSEELFEALTQTTTEAQCDAKESFLVALRRCKAKLNAADEELLKLHYGEDIGTGQIANRMGRPQQSVCNSLTRIRRWLFQCMKKEMTLQERSERGPS